MSDKELRSQRGSAPVPEPEIFTREELARLRAAKERGESLRCPRCEVALVATSVPRDPPVAYVRDRVWHLCPSCRRSAVLDR